MVSGVFGAPGASNVSMPFSDVDPPITLPGLMMPTLNWPFAVPMPFWTSIHGWFAVTDQPPLGAPANVTVTSCGEVTNVSAPPAPFFAAPKFNDAGLRAIAPYTVSVAGDVVAEPFTLVATMRNCAWFSAVVAFVMFRFGFVTLLNVASLASAVQMPLTSRSH